MAIKPPKEQTEALIAVAKLGSEQFDALKAVLDRERPSAQPGQARTRVIGQLRDIGFERGEDLIYAVSAMLHALGLMETDKSLKDDNARFLAENKTEFIDQVVEGIAENENPSLTEEELPIMRDRMLALLNQHTAIAKSIHVQDVLTDHQRVYTRSRILTDIRPIFGEETTDPFTEAVTVHTLKIEYREDGKKKGFFVALDDADLDNLLSVIERAGQKRTSVETRMSMSGVDVYKPERE